MYIGTALIEAMAKTGVTQHELADRVNVTPNLINNLCRGNQQASEELVRQLAAALQCELAITVRFTQKTTPQPVSSANYKSGAI